MKRLHAILAIALTALPSLPSSVEGADIVPLRRGLYVEKTISCENASNATINYFTGNSFGANCNVRSISRISQNSFHIRQVCDARGDSVRTNEIIRILNEEEFSVLNLDASGDIQAKDFRYCLRSSLPEFFRNSGEISDGNAFDCERIKITEITLPPDDRYVEILKRYAGPRSRLADWNEVKLCYKRVGEIFFRRMNLKFGSPGTPYDQVYVQRNGKRYFSPTRPYFVALHGGRLPNDWLAHDQVSNYQITLGSWPRNLKALYIIE
ncbi:MAG: hypothetical protein KF854_00780 [Nitrospira sp.]|nr:hypothetical protein [Nitrospira sp.]